MTNPPDQSAILLRAGSLDDAAEMSKVIRARTTWRLAQIQVVPSLQGIGIGTGVVTSLLREADAASVPVELNVLRVNPAQHLYLRLGFVSAADRGSALTMCYTPEAD